MKNVLYAVAITLAVGAGAQAQQMSSTQAEQSAKFSQQNTPQQKEFTGDTSALSTDLLDLQDNDAAFRGGGGRPGGGGGFAPHPGGGFAPGPRPGGIGPRPGVGPGPRPGFGPRPGVSPGPRPGFGARPGGFGPRPGWTPAFRWNRAWRPGWFRPGLAIPAFFWAADVVAGEWQCTAYNANLAPVTDFGADQDQAAYNALYACGGADYEAAGCYIPDGYCQFR